MNLAGLTLIFALALPALAQTNSAVETDSSHAAAPTHQTHDAAVLRAEQIRADCIAGRRCICGKIMKILPEGLVVESGYTNLLREPLTRSWLVPGTVTTSRPEKLVESGIPGTPCVGTVLLTDYPKSRKLKPKAYDYVIIEGYPTGQHTYHSVGTVQKTVRRFSAQLATAVAWHLAEGSTNASPSSAGSK